MMTASGLKSAIEAKFNPAPTVAATANTLFGEAVKEYLEAECEVTYSWAAVNGSGTPDPIVTFTAKPTFASFVIAPVANLTLWAVALYTQILGAVMVPDDATFIVAPTAFGPVPFTLTASGATDFDTAMTYTCNEILNGIKLMLSIVPASGAHGVYTGSGLIVTIR